MRHFNPILQNLALFGCAAAFAASGRLGADARSESSGNVIIPEPSLAVPFDVPVPAFPDRRFDVTQFGAKGDGKTLNTEAFAKAISACAQSGGGRVVVPAGLWLTGPIVLQSNVDLHLEERAFVVFDPNLKHYPLIETSYEGLQAYRRQSPISGRDLINVAITGKGIVDGSGQAWRPVKKGKMTESQWQGLLNSGGAVDRWGSTWYPSSAALGAAALLAEVRDPKRQLTMEAYEAMGEYLRPVLVSLVRCKNVLLEGPTFQNSPAWNLHPLMCENVTLRHLTVKNPWYSQNGDGVDLESCRNAVVASCNFDVGDDAICMKSGRNEEGRKRGLPTENVRILNCVVYHGHGGFVIGSEMSGGVRNVEVNDCIFIGTDTGLRFKSTRGRGGVVEGIRIRNVVMTDIPTQAITFNMYYQGLAPIPDPEDAPIPSRTEIPAPSEETPRFRNISIVDIVCRGAGQAVVLQGLPEIPLENVELKNVFIKAVQGLACSDAEGIRMENVEIVPGQGPVFSIHNSRDVTLDRAVCPPGAEVFLSLSGSRTKDIRVLRTDMTPARKDVERTGDVPADALMRNP